MHLHCAGERVWGKCAGLGLLRDIPHAAISCYLHINCLIGFFWRLVISLTFLGISNTLLLVQTHQRAFAGHKL